MTLASPNQPFISTTPSRTKWSTDPILQLPRGGMGTLTLPTTLSKGILDLGSLSCSQAAVTRRFVLTSITPPALGCSGLMAPSPSAVLSCHLWNQFDSRVDFTGSKHPLADLIIFRDQKVSVICGPTYHKLEWGRRLPLHAASPERGLTKEEEEV